ELQIVFKNVFDSQKHVAESHLAHERRKRVAVIRNRRSHRLNRVINLVQPRVYDCLTERFKTFDVERDVIVNYEDRSRAVIRGVLYVCDDAIKSVCVKITPAHLDDRAETAIECAAARSLYHIRLSAKHRVAFQHSRIT